MSYAFHYADLDDGTKGEAMELRDTYADNSGVNSTSATEKQKTYTPRDFRIETRNVVKQDRRRSTLSKRLLPSMGAEKSVSMSTHSPTAQVSQSSLMPARPFPVFEDGSAFC